MYDFRETTPFTGADDNQLPAEAMLIDGQYIENLVPGYRTLQVGGRELLKQSATSNAIGISDGETLEYVRNPSREITVGYQLIADDDEAFRTAFYKLSGILHGDTHQVSFNDDLSVYWNAVLTDVDDVPKGRNAITSSFTLFVPDGIAHSVATQTFDNMPYKDIPLNLMAGTSADPVSVTGSGWNIQKLGSFNNPTVGKKYAATVLLGRADFAVSFQLWANDINGNRISLAGFPVTTQMGANQRSTIVCTWPDPGTTGAAQIEVTLAWAFQKTDVGTYQYLKAKLEEGTTYSTWSPNPADPEYYSDTITVHNGGTYPVEPVITATMHADNGVVAFVNDQGSVLQFGSPSEIDGVVRQKSERVYYFDFENEPNGIVMNDGALTYPNYRDNPATPNKQKGIFSYGRPDGYDNAIAYPNTERNPSNYWSGPSMSGKLAANSNGKQNGNFEWRNLIRFATMTNWAGRVEFNLTYEGKIVASLALYDQSTTDDQVMFEGKIHDGNDARMLFHEALPRDLYSRANSFAVISKMGDQLTFRIDRVGGGNVIRPFTIAGFGALPVDGWTVWFSAFSDVLEANMGWQDSYFDWVNVDYWTDVPNRFKEGDVVKIDVAKRVVSLNGAEDPTLQTVGNNWEGFQLLPGKNTIQVLQSDWAKPYTCQVEWQEAWL